MYGKITVKYEKKGFLGLGKKVLSNYTKQEVNGIVMGSLKGKPLDMSKLVQIYNNVGSFKEGQVLTSEQIMNVYNEETRMIVPVGMKMLTEKEAVSGSRYTGPSKITPAEEYKFKEDMQKSLRQMSGLDQNEKVIHPAQIGSIDGLF